MWLILVCSETWQQMHMNWRCAFFDPWWYDIGSFILYQLQYMQESQRFREDRKERPRHVAAATAISLILNEQRTENVADNAWGYCASLNKSLASMCDRRGQRSHLPFETGFRKKVCSCVSIQRVCVASDRSWEEDTGHKPSIPSFWEKKQTHMHYLIFLCLWIQAFLRL